MTFEVAVGFALALFALAYLLYALVRAEDL